jgi:hypothetical protein
VRLDERRTSRPACPACAAAVLCAQLTWPELLASWAGVTPWSGVRTQTRAYVHILLYPSLEHHGGSLLRAGTM